jgi:nitroreductase
MKTLFLALALISVSLVSCAQDITLPAAQRSGGMPLMEALNNRKSTRQFDENKQLTNQQLADLLWSACGYNREDKLTIPTALNRQEITVYAIMPDGVYRYDARNNALVLITDQDLRHLAGAQEFAQKALLNIAIVSDKSKMEHDIYAGVAAGAVMQNIYLWCASNGIGTVARGNFDGEVLAKALNLDENQRVLLVQTVGY